MTELAIFAVLVIVTEATTEIIVASEFPLFYWIRTNLSFSALPETPRNNLKQRIIVTVYKLLTCGYCFSVWTAGFFALFAPPIFEQRFINWVCATLLLHRLSNWLHVVYELIKKGRIKSHDLEVSLKIIDKDGDNEEYDLNDALEINDGKS